MKKLLIVFVVAVAWLCLPDVVSADEPTHEITVTVNATGGASAASIGCMRGDGYPLIQEQYSELCTDCIQTQCVYTDTPDLVGTYIIITPSYTLGSWDNDTTAGSVITDVMVGGHLVVKWDADVYSGTNWVTYTVELVEYTHQITVTVDATGGASAASIGCMRGDGYPLIEEQYSELCTDCLQAQCVYTDTPDTVGTYIIITPGYLNTWDIDATAGSVITDVLGGGHLVVKWNGDAYNGSNWVTYTVTLFDPTPMPTPTLDPTEYSEEYRRRMANLTERVYLPYVARGGLPADGGESGGVGGYTGDTTWWDWAQKIEAFFAPVFAQIGTVRVDIDDLHRGACGTNWTAFTPPIDPTSAMVEAYMLEGTPTATETAYVMGVSLGRPMAWIRSIQQSNSILGLNFFVMLIYFLAAGIGWLVFVTVITYSARMIRYAIAMVIRLYELVPFKAT